MFLRNIGRILAGLEDPRMIKAAATWPKFSLAAFTIVSRLDRLGFRPRTVIDVGANVGQFANAAAALFPDAHVHSFEPVPEVHARLEANLSRYRNVTTYEAAVADRSGTTQFLINSDSQVSSMLQPSDARLRAYPSSVVQETITVREVTLDEVFAGRSLDGPVLLKLDVQGVEDRALAGAKSLLAVVDYIVVELSLKPLYEGELGFTSMMDRLAKHGFEPVQPLDLHWSPADGSVIEMDWLFLRARPAADSAAAAIPR